MSYLVKLFKVTRRILPAIIGVIVCAGDGFSGESGVKAERYTAGQAYPVMLSAGRAETKDTLDAAGKAVAIDIDDTMDLRINALAGLAVFVYFAQMGWKVRNPTT
jgi:hypothetical protein